MDGGTASTRQRALSIAILAMGGEGGGVLADWIVDMAEQAGWRAQTTSVPGVAQRTGATIYYVELLQATAGRKPVFAMMPVPGDVDIVVASELMEAARAVQRGLVTPDRTVFVVSTHRVYAMTEKIAMTDGRVDPAPLMEACAKAARRLVAADMARIAEASRSVIGAVLFGALCRSGALPFPREAFEDAIRRGGIGVDASLRAFARGCEADDAAGPGVEIKPSEADVLIQAGLDRLADYQDRDYAAQFLARLQPVRDLDAIHGDGSGRLLAETARQLALGMAYEDTIRVAELKIRAARFDRVRREVKLRDGQMLGISEYLHPRVEEIADTLPAGLGRWLLRNRWARGLVGRMTARGRRVRTTTITGFLLLSLVAGRKPKRRSTLRFAVEQAELDRWLALVTATAPQDYALACEIAECRTLVKGYGDTHARGRANFDRLMAALPALRTRPDGAAALAALRQAAVADDTGAALNRALEALPRP